MERLGNLLWHQPGATSLNIEVNFIFGRFILSEVALASIIWEKGDQLHLDFKVPTR